MTYSIRTKTITSSTKIFHDFGDQKYIDYQPGNGTRYDLLFVKLKGEIPDEVGGSEWMVTWVWKRSILLCNSHQYLDVSYVAEKFKTNVADAICLAEIIGHIIKCPSTTCYDFDPELRVREIMES